MKKIRIALAPEAKVPGRITDAMKRRSHVLLIDDDEWDPGKGTDLRSSRVEKREEADALLRKGDVDLVLLDLHIGAGPTDRTTEGGMLLLRWLRSRFAATPVYLFSESPEKRGLSPEALQRVSAEGGAAGILQKRFHGDAEEELLARDGFFRQLREVERSVKRQKLVEQYRYRLKLVEFDLHRAKGSAVEGTILLEIGGIREVTAISPEDRDIPGWVDLPRERFDDIAGAENAKRRLGEVVRWLSDPRPVIDMGLDLPKGILLTGPPGTGKTSLARAVAGEAQVPFFAISGASVYRKYVGESEATIRNLFAAARRYAPSVVFIDEIDAIGAERSGSSIDNAARVGVLNELLAQMDGFVQSGRPVFVMAATNRADILDPALVRSGRFDLSIEVPIPNAPAREEIFRVHLRRVEVEEDVDVAVLAGRTAGLSGADIMQICKEAGFVALREGAKRIARRHLDEAITTVRFGLSSERVLLDDASKWSTAIHEAGHALAQHLIFLDEPVSQISILPRGRALGFTEHLPTRHYVDQSRKRLRGILRVLLAGRAAEKMVLGADGVTSGCSEDLERASALALRMTVAWGMDDGLGPVSLPGVKQGLSIAEGMPLESSAHDEAIAASRRLLEEEEGAVLELLGNQKDRLLRLAEGVKAKETLGGEELRELLEAGREKEK
ncbi:MAG: AAA family ATPase [Candidatus Eisenbacteria bacterium]